jgi:hypothetical protein
MAKLLTISELQSGNLVLQKTCLIHPNNSGFTKNWFYRKPACGVDSVYLVLWQSGFTENLLTRYDSNLSGFMAIWFYRKSAYWDLGIFGRKKAQTITGQRVNLNL